MPNCKAMAQTSSRVKRVRFSNEQHLQKNAKIIKKKKMKEEEEERGEFNYIQSKNIKI